MSLKKGAQVDRLRLQSGETRYVSSQTITSGLPTIQTCARLVGVKVCMPTKVFECPTTRQVILQVVYGKVSVYPRTDRSTLGRVERGADAALIHPAISGCPLFAEYSRSGCHETLILAVRSRNLVTREMSYLYSTARTDLGVDFYLGINTAVRQPENR